MSNINNNPLDLIDVLRIFTKNIKKIFLFTFLFTFLVFLMAYYFNQKNIYKYKNIASFNIIINDMGTNQTKTMLDKLDQRLSSAANFEKWSAINNIHSKLLKVILKFILFW